MASEVVRQLTPEEEELVVKREELARLQSELADRELDLASLNAELAAFERLYLRRVGVLYAQLDEWHARLAELRARDVGTHAAEAEAFEARAQAQESYSEAHANIAGVQSFKPSPELKTLYREAAKRIHPDTATNDAERARRQSLMQQVNAAYARSDEDVLRRILDEFHASPDTVLGEGIGADLIRVLRQLKQVRGRIAAVEVEIRNTAANDLAKLKAKVDTAASDGRDLLAEMAANVQGRIDLVEQQFEKTKARVQLDD